jgi:hypothetical protein
MGNETRPDPGNFLANVAAAGPNIIQLNHIYIFIRSRQLESTYPGEPQLGVWPITSLRVRYGWGSVTLEDWPWEADTKWPPDEPPGLDEVAKANRIQFYQRARNLAECKIALHGGRPPITSVEITHDWDNPAGGIIPDPKSDDVIIGCHAIPFLKYSDPDRQIGFPNSWGTEWGNNGNGTISYEYFRKRSIESWFWTEGYDSRRLADYLMHKKKLPSRPSGPVSLIRTIRDPLRSGAAYSVEI